MMKRACLAVVLACSLGWASQPSTEGPAVYALGLPANFAKAKQTYQSGDKNAKAAVGGMVKGADASLDAPVYTVTGKPFTPPSGDKHDYMSLSTYWWPDPSKPDGLPYIRKDGQFNPEREKYDLPTLENFSAAVENLSLAYYFTGDERYATKCAGLIRAWCVDPATRMNPNLTYAQFVPGNPKPRNSGLIDGGRLKRVVDAVGFLKGSPSWTDADDKATREWFGKLLTFITTTKQGKDELNAKNNHGTWCHVQAATYALFLGDKEKARSLLEDDFKKRIDSQIKADGSQPEELARTLSFHYSRFNLFALMDEADLGDRVGLDLWNYKTSDGRSIRTALDYLVPTATGDAKWVKKDIEDPNGDELTPLLRRAAIKYNDPKYAALADRLLEKNPNNRLNLLWPSPAR